jgi:cobalt-zinc-cadmium efflux system outer membrane protein
MTKFLATVFAATVLVACGSSKPANSAADAYAYGSPDTATDVASDGSSDAIVRDGDREPVMAQGSVQRLTASMAIRLALAHNPDSRAADQDVLAARGVVQQARLWPNPALLLGSMGTGVDPAEAPIPNQFGLIWTIPLGFKRAAAVASAKAGVSASRASRVASRRQLAFAVETAFVTILLDQSLLAFAKEDQQTFQQSVQINELRYKDGKISYGDVLKLRIQARQVDDAVREANQNLVNDRLELARLVGEGVLAPNYQVVGTLTPPNVPRDFVVSAIVRRALHNRADYQALRAQQDASSSALSLARRQPIPDVGLLAEYNHVPDATGNWAGNYDIQLTLSLPLFDQNQGNVKQAGAVYAKSGLALEAMRTQIRADAARAVETWQTVQSRLRDYNDEFVKQAKESLDISRHSYEEGRGTLLDFLDAESSYRDVQRAYRTAEANAVLAAANIKFVSGEDLP